MKKMNRRQRLNLNSAILSCVGQIGFVFFAIVAIIGGIIFYPYILWCDLFSSPHYEESGYDV
jgi:hypothetical protein